MRTLSQLLTDVQRGVRILHEWTFKGTRYRAYTIDDPECAGAVYIDRFEPLTKRWEQTSCLVEEDAALVLELAKLAGRKK